jgi:hypothetical protein
MYYVNYDEDSGEILGIYPESYNYDEIPSPNIAITNEEWTALGSGYWVVRDGVVTDGYSPTPTIEDYTPTDVGNYDDDTYDEDYSTALQNEYVKKFESLQNAYVGALIMGYTAMMADIRRDYANLLEEFRQVQMNDMPYEDTNHEHCEVCGRVLENGACPNCYWRK